MRGVDGAGGAGIPAMPLWPGVGFWNGGDVAGGTVCTIPVSSPGYGARVGTSLPVIPV